MTDLPEIILTIPMFLLAISFHEYAHALTAVSLGDPTPKYQGRLTMNFLAHFSWLGALMLLIAGIGWAKPVQVTAHNLRNPRQGMVWVSCAGPAANLLLAIALAGVFRIVRPFLFGVVGQVILMLLFIGVRLNLLLAFFNLIPIPPLDGAKIIAPVIPRKWAYTLSSLEPWGFILVFVLFRYLGLGTLLAKAIYFSLQILL